MEKDGTEIVASGELLHGRTGVTEEAGAIRVSATAVGNTASLSAWHTLELAFECEGGDPGYFTASIDGAVVTSGNTNATAGMAGLSSGWHVAEFDRFDMSGC